MARGGPCGAAFGTCHIEISVVKCELGRLAAEAFHFPVFRILPSFVNLVALANGGKAVARQLDHGAAGEVEVTVAEAVDYITGVDVTHLQVNGLAPRAPYVGGPSHTVGAMGRVIDIELAIVLYEVGGIARAGHTADRFPRQQVARMPNEESRGITERRMSHVIVFTIANNLRVCKVARQYGTGETANGVAASRRKHENRKKKNNSQLFHYQ